MAVKEAVKDDSGLGLNEFLGGESEPAKEAESVPVKADASSSIAESEKPKEAEAKKVEPDPVVQEELPLKTDAKPAEAAKAEPDKIKEVKSSASPAPDVEALQKELDRTRKQYEDTRNWATQVNQDNLASKRQLEIINKKLDGTYDPEKDAVQAPNPNQIAAAAEAQGRVKASELMAREQYGNEQIDAWMNELNTKYANDPVVQMRVLSHPTPVLEGIRVLKEAQFSAKYGRDPEKIEKAIRESVLKDMEPKIDDIVNKRIKERLSQKDSQVTTLADARSANDAKNAESASDSLRDIFG